MTISLKGLVRFLSLYGHICLILLDELKPVMIFNFLPIMLAKMLMSLG